MHLPAEPIPITGMRLPANTLQELILSSPIVVLHFLRHLRCMYCHYSVERLRQAQKLISLPPVYFIHPNSLEEGETFFAKRWENAAHITDPELRLYKLFNVPIRAPLGKLFSLQSLKIGLKLLLQGVSNYHDPKYGYMLGATFLFYEGKVRKAYYARFLGDEPQWTQFR
ncbi:MAG: hypothetical protein ACUVRD_06035 [Bacteroidia bacterium]